MRIIAGQFRSRPLKSVTGETTRPTSDRLRETLFNVLQAMGPLDRTVFLDVYAGTGAVGIEDPLQQVLGIGFDLAAPLGERMSDRGLAHDFAHRALGRRFQGALRVADVEQV